MFGYSETNHVVFVLRAKEKRRPVTPAVEVDTKLLSMRALTRQQWKKVRRLQSPFRVWYLRFRYGSADTYMLLGFVEEKLAHIQWIVPASVIKSRYTFVSENSYSIISCLTSQSFRSLGIYPSQIQKVVESNIPAKTFWIWTASTNTPSLKGIRKAGGVKVAELVQKKWFWGCISHIEYFPEGNNNRKFQ